MLKFPTQQSLLLRNIELVLLDFFQIIVSLIPCNGLVLPYSIDIYDKDYMIKIELTQKLITTLLKLENKAYILAVRQAIEPFFRDCKTYLGLDGNQVKSKKSINRYLIIMLVNYTYCEIYCIDFLHINTEYELLIRIQKSLK